MRDSRTIYALIITALSFFAALILLFAIMAVRDASDLNAKLDIANLELAATATQLDAVSTELATSEQALDESKRKLKQQDKRIDSLKSDFSFESRRDYQEIFKSKSANEIEKYLEDMDDSLATQAAWQLVKLTIPDNRDSEWRPVGKRELDHFLKFFVQRNHIEIPDWWKNEIVNCGAYVRTQPFTGRFGSSKSLYGSPDKNWAHYPPFISIQEENDRIVLTENEDSIAIPRRYLRDGKFRDSINVKFTDDRCFLAIHNCAGYSHDLVCLDRKSGKIEWKSDVCGYATWGGTSGHHQSWVTVETTKDGRVFVFGSGTGGFYAHGFQISNGRSMVYFASNF